MSACAYAMAIAAIKNPADPIAFMIRLFELRHPHGGFESRAFPYPSVTIFALGTAGTSPMSRARRIRRSLPQRDAITHQAHSAILVLAPPVIVDAIAVADVEPALAAVLPN